VCYIKIRQGLMAGDLLIHWEQVTLTGRSGRQVRCAGLHQKMVSGGALL
jgi:hypothetical protein